jgi:hypothetical protein
MQRSLPLRNLCSVYQSMRRKARKTAAMPVKIPCIRVSESMTKKVAKSEKFFLLFYDGMV